MNYTPLGDFANCYIGKQIPDFAKVVGDLKPQIKALV
jgi:hypothetical protein